MPFIPEFAILRDGFGSRMNTIFKFYYQSWLLFGLGGAYVIMRASRAAGSEQIAGLAPRILAGVAAVLFASALITPIAGIYIRANRFNNENRTFDARWHYRTAQPIRDGGNSLGARRILRPMHSWSRRRVTVIIRSIIA